MRRVTNGEFWPPQSNKHFWNEYALLAGCRPQRVNYPTAPVLDPVHLNASVNNQSSASVAHNYLPLDTAWVVPCADSAEWLN